MDLEEFSMASHLSTEKGFYNGRNQISCGYVNLEERVQQYHWGLKLVGDGLIKYPWVDCG